MQLYEIITDDTLQSSANNGEPAFPFASYYDEIDRFKERCIAWHWHKEFEFTLVEHGPVTCQIGAESIVLATGDGLFINGGVIHRFVSGGNGIMRDILFAPEFIAPQSSVIFQKYVAPAISSSLRYDVFRGAEPLHEPLLSALGMIYRLAQTDDSLWELRVRNAVSSFWERFFPTIKEQLSEHSPIANRLLQARMQLMLDYIRREYARPIRLGDIAAAAQISKSEALRCFRQSIQISPINYLTDYRMTRASELLQTGSSTVSSIAWETGFRSAGYFCRVFKARFGQTPEEFRKAHPV